MKEGTEGVSAASGAASSEAAVKDEPASSSAASVEPKVEPPLQPEQLAGAAVTQPTTAEDVPMEVKTEEGEPAKPPAMRLLISKGYVQFAQCLIEEAKYEELLIECTKWMKKTRGAEGQQEDWLAIRYHMADAAIRWAAATPGSAGVQGMLPSIGISTVCPRRSGVVCRAGPGQ